MVAAIIGFAILHTLKRDDPEPELNISDEPSGATTPRPVATSTIAANQPEAAPAIPRAAARVIADIGLPVGTPAPEFVLPDLEGQRTRSHRFGPPARRCWWSSPVRFVNRVNC